MVPYYPFYNLAVHCMIKDNSDPHILVDLLEIGAPLPLVAQKLRPVLPLVGCLLGGGRLLVVVDDALEVFIHFDFVLHRLERWRPAVERSLRVRVGVVGTWRPRRHLGPRFSGSHGSLFQWLSSGALRTGHQWSLFDYFLGHLCKTSVF